jgi:protein-disulfide isomerase-like protein with CxxC motif
MSISPLGAAACARNYSLTESSTSVKPKTAAQELDEYVKMTPEQRMRADILNKLGLTEEELAAMSPEDRQAAEQKIAEMSRELMQHSGERKGSIIDTSA